MKMATFNPNEHLIQIKSGKGDNAKSSDYLQVMWRLVWFRAECPEGTIETEMLLLDLDKECEEEAYVWNAEKRRSEKVMKTAKGVAMFRAVVKDGKGGVATGTKMEKAVSFSDFVEKSETGAIGRALASLGYGTQFTGDEFDEKTRIVDSPVDQQQSTPSVPSVPTPAPASEPRHLIPAVKPPVSTTSLSEDVGVPVASEPLLAAAKKAKKRAYETGAVKSEEQWLALLDNVGVKEFKSGSDIAKVNGKITEIERALEKQQPTAKAS
jgi:hypothetical protein